MVKKELKKIAKTLIGKSRIRQFLFNSKLKKIRKNHIKASNSLKGKRKIKVAFFLIHDSVWKYERLYNLLREHPRFKPTVFVCPYIRAGNMVMQADMKKAFLAFKERGYDVKKTQKADGSWLDVKNEFKPDLVFFTNPHNLTRPEYLITNFLDTLTCYVPYNFGNSHLLNMFHNQDFHNYLWRLFTETLIHQKFSKLYARNKGENTLVTGFPGTDAFLIENKSQSSSLWKSKNTIKIIWAPHHTIDDNKSFLSFSSFLVYYHYILFLLEKYSGKVEIAFKPHPLLKAKLYKHNDWGIEKTDRYYHKWNELENGFLADGDYIDLFKTSDALIHDSGSFLIEYLYTEKPVLRTDVDDNVRDRINEFGLMAYDVHYIAKSKKQVEGFIEKLIRGVDVKYEDRIRFKKKWLIPPGGNLASDNIMDFLKSELV